MNKAYLIMILSVAVAAVSQIFLKCSANKEHTTFIKEYCNIYVITGYALLFCSTLLTIFAFKGMNYKNGPVLESLGYFFVLILCRLFLSEKITVQKLFGNFLIILGIFIFYL